MSKEKDEDLETLTETCENEVEPEPKAKQYSQAGVARNPRCKKLSLALFQSGAKKLN